MSVLLSMELLRRPELLVTLMTMRWQETSTVPKKRADSYQVVDRRS